MKLFESLQLSNKLILLLLFYSILFAKNDIQNNLTHDFSVKNSFPYLSNKETKLSRPQYLDKSYISENGLFKFHYTLTGSDAIDSTSTNSKNIPDWIYEAEIAINKAHHILIDSLGFDSPPSDGDEYDIFFCNFNAYGYTNNETLVVSTSRKYDFISYMEIENDFIGFKTTGFDALRVTIAHEYFHAVQMGYNFNFDNYLPNTSLGDAFFFEWSSVWFEDICYPQVNDYIQYSTTIMNYMDSPIWYYSSTSNFPYAQGIFLKYLIENYSIQILTKTWDKIKNNERAFYALQKTIKEYTNSNLAQIYNEYCQRLYFSGAKYNESFSVCEDAQYFAELNINWGERYEFNNYLKINESVDKFTTLPIEIAFSSQQDFGLLENLDFKQDFIGSYIFKKNKNIQMGTLNLTSDQYIDNASNGDTLILFITNQDIENKIDLELKIDFVEPHQQFTVSNIFPNPIDNNGKITVRIETNYIDDIEIEIFNLLGQKILKKSYLNQSNQLYSLDLGNDFPHQLASGIYFMKIRSGKLEKIKKLTIIK